MAERLADLLNNLREGLVHETIHCEAVLHFLLLGNFTVFFVS